MDDVRLERTLAPNRTLRARLRRPGGTTGWALLVPGYLAHGDGMFFPELGRALAERGVASLAVTLSGSGFDGDGRLVDEAAFASNTYAQELDDLVAARSLAGELGLPGDPVVIGHSRGAAMGLLHADAHGARAFVGLAAGSHVGRFRPERVESWRRDGRLPYELADGRTWWLGTEFLDDLEANRARYDLAAAASRFERPALLVFGTRDRAVPIEEAREHAARFPHASTIELEGSRHSLRASPPERYPWIDRVAEFVAGAATHD